MATENHLDDELGDVPSHLRNGGPIPSPQAACASISPAGKELIPHRVGERIATEVIPALRDLWGSSGRDSRRQPSPSW
jgi:hypothetical protein